MLSSCDNVREALLLARHLEIGLGDADTLYVHVYNWPGDTPAEEWLSFYQPPSVVAMAALRCGTSLAGLRQHLVNYRTRSGIRVVLVQKTGSSLCASAAA